MGNNPEHLVPGTENEVLVSLESEVRWYETVDTTVVIVPVVMATSSGPICRSVRPTPVPLGLKELSLQGGAEKPWEAVSGGPKGSPLGGLLDLMPGIHQYQVPVREKT